MEPVVLLERARDIGLKVWADGDSLKVEGVPNQDVVALVEDLRAHKKEVIYFLEHNDHSPIQSKPLVVEGPKEWHAEEVAWCVEKEGVCIFWSDLFGEVVAFVKDESYKSKVPGDIVTYTSQEIRKLFPSNGGCPSKNTLRLIHEAKKLGGGAIEGI